MLYPGAHDRVREQRIESGRVIFNVTMARVNFLNTIQTLQGGHCTLIITTHAYLQSALYSR